MKDTVATQYTLRMHFSGLSVFATVEQGEMVVLLPDARENSARAGGLGMRHADGMDAVAHAGYLAFDVRHLSQDAGAGEVVVRLDREAVRLDGMPAGAVKDTVELPDFSVFAPIMRLDSTLRSEKPAESLLARLHLSGGTLTGSGDGIRRTITRVLTSPKRPGHQQASTRFAHNVEYQATVPHDRPLTVTLTQFGTGVTRAFTLTPIDGVISLRLANLCGENPLEWREFPVPKETPARDVDFKWLSTLFTPRDGEEAPQFSPSDEVPHLLRIDDRMEGVISNCFPSRGEF